MLVCYNCGKESNTPEDNEFLYWIERSGAIITKITCDECSAEKSEFTPKEGMAILKLATEYKENNENRD